MIDGEKVTDFVDATHPKGRIGFRCEIQTALAVDNLQIEHQDGSTQAFRFDDSGEGQLFGPDLGRDRVVVAAAVPADQGLAGAIDLTPNFTQGLPWDSGREKWTVFFFAQRPYSPRGYGNWFDNLNPEATARFVDAVYGNLKRHFGWALGSVLEGGLSRRHGVRAGTLPRPNGARSTV